MLGPTIDMIWVGALGTAALAGVGISGIAVMMIKSARMGLNTGTRAMIARFVGARDEEGANHIAQQAIIISVAFSIVTAIIGVVLAEPILIFGWGIIPGLGVAGAALTNIISQGIGGGGRAYAGPTN